MLVCRNINYYLNLMFCFNIIWMYMFYSLSNDHQMYGYIRCQGHFKNMTQYREGKVFLFPLYWQIYLLCAKIREFTYKCFGYNAKGEAQLVFSTPPSPAVFFLTCSRKNCRVDMERIPFIGISMSQTHVNNDDDDVDL